MKSEKRDNIAMIERMNDKITVLTGEVKILQSDKDSHEIKFSKNFNSIRVPKMQIE